MAAMQMKLIAARIRYGQIITLVIQMEQQSR